MAPYPTRETARDEGAANSGSIYSYSRDGGKCYLAPYRRFA